MIAASLIYVSLLITVLIFGLVLIMFGGGDDRNGRT